MFSGLTFKFGLVAVIILALGVCYAAGYRSGKQSVLMQLANDRITILKDGQRIDKEVELLDPDGLCAVLGGCGLPDESNN